MKKFSLSRTIWKRINATDKARLNLIPGTIRNIDISSVKLSLSDSALDEAATNVLSDAMPVMFVSAMNEETLEKSKRDSFGPRGPFVCPMYVNSDRSEKSMVATVSLASKSRPPEHWILRGTALVCE